MYLHLCTTWTYSRLWHNQESNNVPLNAYVTPLQWLESLAFVVLICVEKKSSKGKLASLSWTLQLLLLLHSHPKLSWHSDYWEYDLHPEWLNVICRNLKSKISNSCPKSYKVFSLWVHHLTSPQNRTRNHGIQSCAPVPQRLTLYAVKHSWP